MRNPCIAAIVLLAWTGSLAAQDKSLSITVTAGKNDLKHVPVCVPLSLSKEQAKDVDAELSTQGQKLTGQLTAPGIITESIAPSRRGLVRRDLHFILPALKAGETITLKVQTRLISPVPDPVMLVWSEEVPELVLSDPARGVNRPILRYMKQAYDKSTPDQRDRTYKVFHHVYDPAGKRFVTNGGENDLKPGEKAKLLYPHHRGLMFGFNRITYGNNKQADTWHCGKGEHQSHVNILNVEAGPVLGRHRVLVDWYGRAEDIFAKEERELTVYNVPGGTLVEFASRMTATNDPVKLDGDPQHAGFQFRAAQQVADKAAGQTYFLRPDGKGEPGKTRNWPEFKKHANLPWDAMSFVIDGKRYTAAYLNHPKNPGESRWSERDYGRFGCYFPFEMTKKRPLVVNYRVWLQDGDMTGDQVQALSDGFVAPPGAKAN
jgi:hypothetical protein